MNPKSETVEISFMKNIKFFDTIFDYACDQKLLLVTFYVKTYLVMPPGPGPTSIAY